MEESFFYKPLFITLFLVLSLPTFANQTESEPKDVERIEIIGERPLAYHHKIYLDDQFAYFNKFNELVEDKDMHYLCDKKKNPLSHLKTTSCQSAFEIRIKKSLFDEKMRANSDLGIVERATVANVFSDQGSAEMRELAEEKQRLILNMYHTNKSFRETLEKLIASKKRYEKAHAKKFGAASRFSEK